MIKTIVCPVDFSPFSERALKFASSLADKHDARLVIVHVIENVMPAYASLVIPSQAHGVELELQHLAEREMDDFLQDFGDQPQWEKMLLVGRPLEGILQACRQHHADIVVMGTHGKSFLERALFGSVTEKVLRRLHLPILLVNLPTDS